MIGSRLVASVGVLSAILAGCSEGERSVAPAATPSPGTAMTVSSPVDPVVAKVSQEVKVNGAAGYLHGVTDRDADWQHVLVRLAAGDSGALELARQLRPAADAGIAESLDTAAARALPVAPAAVLGLTTSGFPVAQLCTSPFIEPEAGVEKNYNDAALKALDALPAAERRQPAYDDCRGALASIAKQLRQP